MRGIPLSLSVERQMEVVLLMFRRDPFQLRMDGFQQFPFQSFGNVGDSMNQDEMLGDTVNLK